MKYNKVRNTYIIVSFLTVFFLHITTPIAKAESISLSIAPSIFQIEALPPSDVRAPFTIKNQSDEPVELKILLKPFRSSADGNGQIEYFNGGNAPIYQNIQVVDGAYSIDTITLGPKQEKKLSLRVVVPEKETYADHYFSIVFLASPEKAGTLSNSEEKNNLSTAQGAIAANVLLSIGPKDQAKGYIDQFSAPIYVESGPVPFTLKVKNTGSHFMAPKGVVLIKNMFGQTIGRVEIPPMNILAGMTRSMIDLEQATKNSAYRTMADPKTMWSEKFLLGIYHADLSLALSDNGPVYNQSVTFIAFPIKLLLGIIIGIIITLLVYFRVKKKLQTE